MPEAGAAGKPSDDDLWAMDGVELRRYLRERGPEDLADRYNSWFWIAWIAKWGALHGDYAMDVRRHYWRAAQDALFGASKYGGVPWSSFFDDVITFRVLFMRKYYVAEVHGPGEPTKLADLYLGFVRGRTPEQVQGYYMDEAEWDRRRIYLACLGHATRMMATVLDFLPEDRRAAIEPWLAVGPPEE